MNKKILSSTAEDFKVLLDHNDYNKSNLALVRKVKKKKEQK